LFLESNGIRLPEVASKAGVKSSKGCTGDQEFEIQEAQNSKVI